MTVKELIEKYSKFHPDTQVLVASDEELNTIYKDFTINVIELPKSNGIGTYDASVIFGHSGSEIDY